uniref:Uncharacterized protein n=1 Tax=Anguilla anguilla TaxID=7936 RepID=A0A0E9XV66_ANGAN
MGDVSKDDSVCSSISCNHSKNQLLVKGSFQQLQHLLVIQVR